MEFDTLGQWMILPDLVLPSRANRHWQYSGGDSLDQCLDRKHFLDYPHRVEYDYNSRGFRDREWPHDMEELRSATWCIGDSFTVGIGQPLAHIWPVVLAERQKQRTINVSMDGASNDWIYRRALNVMCSVAPAQMIVMWSYTHRRESPRNDLSDEQRLIFATRSSTEQDYAHWADLSNRLYLANSEITQITIPDFHKTAEALWHAIKGPDWPACPKTLSDLGKLPAFVQDEIKDLHRCHDQLTSMLAKDPTTLPNLLADIIHIHSRLDWARDHHHFDILTSQWVVDQILQRQVAQKISRIPVPARSVSS